MLQMSKNTDHPVIRKILVAVDGSETSSKAAENASELAEKYGADLIALYIVPLNIKSSEIFDLAKQYVLGTRGISGIKRMLLGSTASGVVTYSHCPVMVVK